jgi:hypothetical protein
MKEVADPPRRRGGDLGPVVIAVTLVIAVVVGTRWAGTSGGRPEPSSPAAAAGVPTLASSPNGARPASTGGATIRPRVVRTEAIDALAGTALGSYSDAALLSVSPDGRHGLLRSGLGAEPRVDLLAVPLAGGAPIPLGVAGWEPRSPADNEIRLALPAWSADGTAVAFENGAEGTIASLAGDAPIRFAALPDAPLSALSGGGFVFNTASGPRVAGRPDVPPLAPVNGLRDVVYFPDGRAAVGTDATGSLVWTDGVERNVVATQPNYAFPLAWRLVSRSSQVLVLVPEILPIRTAYAVNRTGMITILELDGCGAPSVSDDGMYAALHTCNRSVIAGSAAYYSLRIIRLSDGAAVDVGPGAVEPVFLPGTHRLVWLGLSGNPPVAPTFTLSVASTEVLP